MCYLFSSYAKMNMQCNVVNINTPLDGWMGRVWVELKVQPPPYGEFWVIFEILNEQGAAHCT